MTQYNGGANNDYGNGYGKMSMWQWIALYLVIGGVVYGLIYYFMYANKNGNPYGQAMNYPSPTNTQISPAVSESPTGSNTIYTTKTDSAKGTYMTDTQGMTLYTFDKDTPGVSTCYDGCAKAWPPYTSGATAQSTLPQNITVVKRTDGSTQFAWKGMPLYYFATDKKAGDIIGDGVGGVWHLVKP